VSASARQPWLHALEIAVDGPATMLSARTGSLRQPGCGLIVDDRRVLSLDELHLDEEAPVAIQAASMGNRTRIWSCARNVGAEGPDPTVEVHVDRGLAGPVLTETITLISRAADPVSTTLRLELGGDGAELSRIKGGYPRGELLPATLVTQGDGFALTWADARHTTTVAVDPVPASHALGTADAPSVVEIPLRLTLGTPVTVTVTVTAERRSGSHFDADAGSSEVDWSQVAVDSGDRRLTQLFATSLTDLRHLLLTDPEAPDEVFAAAGTPWYLTLFGRDSIWAARFLLPFDTTLARGTLRTLARRQGTVVDPNAAEEPGKILHEIRRGQFVDHGGGLDLTPTYYGTVDATPLWLILLHDAWRWGLADDDVRALLPNLHAAMEWIIGAADNDLGLLRYVDTTGHGLSNQGWKDSGDSMRFHDGRIASAPIALLEAQTYAVEAARGAADLVEAMGEGDANAWRMWADALAERIRESYWVERDGQRFLAMALDGDGRAIDGLGSNMGHALGSGALTPAEATSVVETLSAPNLLGEFGISTLSRDNAAYNPIGYHTGSVWTHDTAIALLGMVKEGLSTQAAPIALGLVASAVPLDYRAPELFAGDAIGHKPAPYPASCRPQAWAAASAATIVTAVLGISADVPSGRLRLRPMRPSPFGTLRVDGLRWGATPFSVELDRHGVPTVTGLPDEVIVDIA
jgi:glycogen debranching enzyme